jgi:hypothetical protein
VEKGRVAERVPGREKTGIQFRKPWGRNSPRSLCFSRRVLGIHCSGPNLDSGIFRVVQYRSSTRAGDREKTGMTVFKAVYKERRNPLIQAFFYSPLIFLCLWRCNLLRRRLSRFLRAYRARPKKWGQFPPRGNSCLPVYINACGRGVFSDRFVVCGGQQSHFFLGVRGLV